ncbi:hypothetical protein F396_gp56 [Pectobacterium phage ZF40]|uniref:hypothetical protein n=1 Tax=Pectobacterium phage ZF40 TaxID=1127516 RepID=UPI0002536B62|nr:hypothetical protein [Pectobacterium carotovorum]YP_007006965.1 hypothetical protein F396_gp56 [Pectobacterium phage ZF40]AFC22508.1 hypothetical protein ZF40_0056 [Pectobacterium phage ZF40]ULS51772.1 hypothetical protein GBN63_19225 [Pectobacterium carotovorum]
MRILILLLSMSFLFGCSLKKNIPSGLYASDNKSSKLLGEVIRNDENRYNNKLSSFFDWGDLKRSGINSFDGSKCIRGKCGSETKKNAARMYVIYYTGKHVYNIPEMKWDHPWWSYLAHKDLVKVVRDKENLISSYRNDIKLYDIADLSDEDLFNASVEISNLVNSVIVEKENKERKENEAEKVELNRIAAIPRQRCYFSRDGRKVVDRLIDIVNNENITCQLDGQQPINTRINGRKTFLGNDKSGFLHVALVSDVTLCQAPWWKGGEFEYNECVASVAKGLRMWLTLTRDKSIPDDAFQYCPSYGSELDFFSCAIYVWQYRKIQ